MNGPSKRRSHGRRVVVNFVNSSIDDGSDCQRDVDDDGINGDLVEIPVRDDHVLKHWNDKGRTFIINDPVKLLIPCSSESVSLRDNIHVTRSRSNSLTKSLTSATFLSYDRYIDRCVKRCVEPHMFYSHTCYNISRNVKKRAI